MLVFPTGVAGGIAPADLEPSPGPRAPWVYWPHEGPTTRDGSPAFLYPATIPDPQAPGYSYALVLKRARTDTAEGAPTEVELGAGARGTTPLNGADAYSDALYEVRVMVFRDFDPHEQLASTEDYGAVIKSTNVPRAVFVFLVRR